MDRRVPSVVLVVLAVLLVSGSVSAVVRPLNAVQPDAEIVYFALGDSVASGHGLDDDSASDRPSGCRRSERAYPHLVAERLATENLMTVSFPPEHFLACSGATALEPDAETLAQQPGKWLHNQVDQVIDQLEGRGGPGEPIPSDRPVLVSITIGANDLDWLDPEFLAARMWGVSAEGYLQWTDVVKASVKAAVQYEVERLLAYPNVGVVLTQIHNPINTKSRFFPRVGDLSIPCNEVGTLSCYDRTEYAVRGINDGLFELWDVDLRPEKPGRLRVTLGLQAAFDGHKAPQPMCGDGPPHMEQTWIQYPGIENVNSELPSALRREGEGLGDCIHPNDEGAKVYGEKVVEAALQVLTAVSAPVTIGPTPIGSPTLTPPVLAGVSMFRGNAARTGEYPGPGPTGQPVLRWSFRTGGENIDWVIGIPVVADGTVYIGSEDGKLHAVDEETGIERWSAETGPADGTFPVVAGDLVYIGSGKYETSYLIALDTATGTERWRFEVAGWDVTSPLVLDDVVYAFAHDYDDGGDFLHALDAATGEERWRFEPDSGANGGISPAAAEGVVYLVDDANLYALDAATGTERWRFQPAVETEIGAGFADNNEGDSASESAPDIVTTPAVAGGLVYVRSEAGILHAVDAATGQERWGVEVGGNYHGEPIPAIANGLVYVGVDDGVRAFDAATGTERWYFATWSRPDDPVVANGVVYVNAFGPDDLDGVVAIDATGGFQRWRFALPTDRNDFDRAYLAVADDTIYAGTDGGDLYAIGGSTGMTAPPDSTTSSMFRGNAARTGEQPGPGPNGEPTLLWRFETDLSTGSPRVAGGLVHLILGNALVALDTATGTERWSYAEPLVTITSSPAVVDGTVYAGGRTDPRGGSEIRGFVYALDAATGVARWRFPIEQRFVNASSPAVVDGIVYVGTQGGDDTNGRLYALDAATGIEHWRFDLDATGNVSASPAIADGIVFYTDGQDFIAVDAASGELLWRFAAGSTSTDTPAVADGLLYVYGEANGTDYLLALDATTGQERWRSDIRGTDPMIADGLVYVNRGTSAHVLDAATGVEQWDLDFGVGTSAPVIADGVAYLLRDDGNVIAFDPESADVLWSLPIEAPTGSSLFAPVVVDGAVYVSLSFFDDTIDTYSGFLYAIGGSSQTRVVELGSAPQPTAPTQGAGEEFLGSWEGEDISLVISTSGSLFIIESDNPDGMVNGTFSGELVNGTLVVNPPNFGDIVYVPASDTLLFVGDVLHRQGESSGQASSGVGDGGQEPFAGSKTGWVAPGEGAVTDTRMVQLQAWVDIDDEGVPTDVQFHANFQGRWIGLADIRWKENMENPSPGQYTFDWDVCESGLEAGDGVTLELQVKHGEENVTKYHSSFTSDFACSDAADDGAETQTAAASGDAGDSLSAAAMLPAEAAMPQGLAQTEELQRTAEELAQNSPDPSDLARRLEGWGWRENVVRRFGPPPGSSAPADGTTFVEVSVHLFGSAEAASEALDYFADERATVGDMRDVALEPLGDRSRAITGDSLVSAVPGGNEVTLYVQDGAALIRVTAVSPEGDPAADAIMVAQAVLAE